MAKKASNPMEDFLNEDYKLPDSSGYMKFLPGKNKFRILSSPVTGFEYWTNENKPVRSREKFTETPNIKVEKNGKTNITHFWALVVWNYQLKEVQTLEITQKGILKYILDLSKDPAWGSPKGYDIVVTRTGDGLATKYTCTANPHKEVDEEIAQAYKDSKIDLNALFENTSEE